MHALPEPSTVDAHRIFTRIRDSDEDERSRGCDMRFARGIAGVL
jgi:hypothetical protein